MSNPVDPEHLQDAHALAIGRIVMAWNDYHEKLGEIFASLFSRRDWAIALSAWQALDNDRAQRSMLLAAAGAKLKPTDKAYKEIVWVVEKTNQMISDQRNTGIHTPLVVFHDQDGSITMRPQAMYGHRRAVRLAKEGVELLAEFSHYEKQIRKMFSYLYAINFAIIPRENRRGRVTWPQRPQLLPRAPQRPPKP